MFDIGFWEILIISVLALLVIGPERLPDVARKTGRFVGKMKRFVNSVRSDIEREFRTDELEKMLNQQNQQIQELKNILDDTASTAESQIRETEQLVNAQPEEQQAVLPDSSNNTNNEQQAVLPDSSNNTNNEQQAELPDSSNNTTNEQQTGN